MKIKHNNNDNNLWCNYSKQPIEIGEDYIEVTEICMGEKIVKCYKMEHANVLIDDESIIDADDLQEASDFDFNEGINIEGEGYEESNDG